MSFIFRMVILMLALAGTAQAGGEWDGGKDGLFPDRPLYYAKSCYWHRGVRYCSLYCYVEINGKHYCHERESEAVPQGDPYRPERPTLEEIYRHPRRYY